MSEHQPGPNLSSAAKEASCQFYAVNDRPVKIVMYLDGASDALAFDWSTGGFVPDRSYFGRTMEHGKDIDKFTEAEFRARVMLLRLPIVNRLAATPIAWDHTGDGEIPYSTRIGDRVLTIRVNDFPAEPLYTLLVDGEEVMDMEDWPAAWEMPPVPQSLLDRVGRTTPPE